MPKRVYSEATKAKNRERERQRYAANGGGKRVKAKERMAAWRRDNPEKARASYRRNGKKASSEQRRRNRLSTYYKITPEVVDSLWEAQDRGCAVCKNACLGKKEPVIDHCHATARVRGLLCTNCNIALGHAKDNPDRLRALAAYVEKYVSTVDTSLETCE